MNLESAQQELKNELKIRNYSAKTIKAYVFALVSYKKFINNRYSHLAQIYSKFIYQKIALIHAISRAQLISKLNYHSPAKTFGIFVKNGKLPGCHRSRRLF